MDYVNYTPGNQAKWQKSLLDCYKAVFAAPPWNEDWWTDKLVLDVLNKYVGANARIILAIDNGVVIGFSCGAVLTMQELTDELGLQLPPIEGALVWYVKDIGVTESFRQKGVAVSLLQRLLVAFSDSDETSGWLYARTLASPNPSVVYRWFPKLGFSTVAAYPKDSNRSGQVILGCPMNKLRL